MASTSKNPLLLLSYATIVALWVGSQTVDINYVANIMVLVTSILYAACHLSLTLREEQALARGEVPPKDGGDGDDDHEEEEEERPQFETLRAVDAMQFPLLGSCSLFGLYLAFKFFDKDTVNLVISVYFCLVGLAALTATFGPVIGCLGFDFLKAGYSKTLSVRHPLPKFVGGESPWVWNLDFAVSDALAFLGSSAFVARYFLTKHWTMNNVMGICFCLQGIERFSLGTYRIGAILLVGLFFYDIFWVFGTDVMVTVAKSLDGPIKILFPRSLARDAVTGKLDMSLLGLGDIVLPGFFLALLLRFDAHVANLPVFPTNVHASFPKPYFHSGLLGYVVGLGTTLYVMIGEFSFLTIVLVFFCSSAPVGPPLDLRKTSDPFSVGNGTNTPPRDGGIDAPSSRFNALRGPASKKRKVFEAAQPALLYLVPACLGSSLLCAFVRGELKELFDYSEEDEEEEEAEEEGEKEKEKEKDEKTKKDD
jgi:minor histocompatibility antigen H13